MPKIQNKNSVTLANILSPEAVVCFNCQATFLNRKDCVTNFCLHRGLMSVAFPFIFANRNFVITDTELTEQAPSVDSAAALNSLEIHMNRKSLSTTK